MPLVTAADLKDYLKENVPDNKGLEAILVAEAAVAGYIDTPSLDEVNVTETVYTSRETGLVEIASGPLTKLNDVKVNGTTTTLGDWETHPWAIQRYSPLPAKAKVEIDFTRGWNAQNLPEQIRAAILVVAAEVWARPDAAVVRIGTEGLLTAYNRTFITPSAEILLRRWRRPR